MAKDVLSLEDRAIRFAMDVLKRMPQGTPQEREAYITAMLTVFWGACWGTLGTEFARGFIEAQLRGMQPDVKHERFVPPRVQ